MLALCNKLSEREQVEYLNIAAKHGISYAHINLAMRADSVELQMYHYKLAALKHDKFAILELARIYLYKEHPVNWQLAIKCYQQAMNCEYDLGAICVLLILRDYDIGTTIHLLEYEINRKNNKAILALADIYATHNKVNNQTYAMDLYVSANNIDDVGERNIRGIIKTGKISWSSKYHKIWPKISVRIFQEYDFGPNRKTTTLSKISFQQQVVYLLLILKFKNSSCFDYIKSMYKNMVLVIITQLAKIWVANAVVA